jgi:hypothetical protein
VTGYDSIAAIDQDRIDESKLFDGGANLRDLFLGVSARVVCALLQMRWAHIRNRRSHPYL